MTPEQLAQLLTNMAANQRFLLLDVRQADEVRTGYIAGAKHIALAHLASTIVRDVPDVQTKLIVYCETGVRSQQAALELSRLGYRNVYQLDRGLAGWKASGNPVQVNAEQPGASLLTFEQQERYSRHLRLPDFGEQQQRRLLDSRVLIVGLGGLGSPAALYLAAAGVGRLGLLDADTVELSNLQRQILHSHSRLGNPKVASAAAVLTDINHDVSIDTYATRLDTANVQPIFSSGWDAIIDGCDNFATRYLVNDASYLHCIPVVHGSVSRFEGRVTTFMPRHGPCYRCLFPQAPLEGACQTCEQAGVLGVLPGVIGVLQATEAIKLLLGLGEPLLGRLLTYHALTMEFRTLHYGRRPSCTLCGAGLTAGGKPE